MNNFTLCPIFFWSTATQDITPECDCVAYGKASPDSGSPTPEDIQGNAYRGSVISIHLSLYSLSSRPSVFSWANITNDVVHWYFCLRNEQMQKRCFAKMTLKFYDSLLFHYKILFQTLSDVRKSMAAKLISPRFTSPAHLGANKTHHSVWLLSFESSSVITKLLPKVLSVLALPQWIPIASGKCRTAAK